MMKSNLVRRDAQIKLSWNTYTCLRFIYKLRLEIINGIIKLLITERGT